MDKRGRRGVPAPAILPVLTCEVGFLPLFCSADYSADFLPAGLHIYRQHIPHRVRRLNLRGRRDVGVGVQREPRAVVSQHPAHRLDVHAVLESQRSKRVPLRYNNDKPEKSRIFKGFQGFKPDF